MSDRRPETGPMQFGDDWPGVFIRGDNAMAFAMYLGMVLGKADPITRLQLVGLLETLRGCDARTSPIVQMARLVEETE